MISKDFTQYEVLFYFKITLNKANFCIFVSRKIPDQAVILVGMLISGKKFSESEDEEMEISDQSKN